MSKDGRKPSIQFTPSKPALVLIDALLETGLYGANRSAVVRELAYKQLREIVETELLAKIKRVRG